MYEWNVLYNDLSGADTGGARGALAPPPHDIYYSIIYNLKKNNIG